MFASSPRATNTPAFPLRLAFTSERNGRAVPGDQNRLAISLSALATALTRTAAALHATLSAADQETVPGARTLHLQWQYALIHNPERAAELAVELELGYPPAVVAMVTHLCQLQLGVTRGHLHASQLIALRSYFDTAEVPHATAALNTITATQPSTAPEST